MKFSFLQVFFLLTLWGKYIDSYFLHWKYRYRVTEKDLSSEFLLGFSWIFKIPILEMIKSHSMLFFNLECFQGTSFIFLYFPQSFKKKPSEQWQFCSGFQRDRLLISIAPLIYTSAIQLISLCVCFQSFQLSALPNLKFSRAGNITHRISAAPKTLGP